MVKLPQPTKENAPVEVAYFPFKPSSALASAPNFVQVIDAPFKNACANTIAPMPYSFPPDAKSIILLNLPGLQRSADHSVNTVLEYSILATLSCCKENPEIPF
jgi:hypothetical protein